MRKLVTQPVAYERVAAHEHLRRRLDEMHDLGHVIEEHVRPDVAHELGLPNMEGLIGSAAVLGIGGQDQPIESNFELLEQLSRLCFVFAVGDDRDDRPLQGVCQEPEELRRVGDRVIDVDRDVHRASILVALARAREHGAMTESNPPPSEPPVPEQTIRVEEESILIEIANSYRGKTGGYMAERGSIVCILDRSGREVEGRWDDEWVEIAPGIKTRGQLTTAQSRAGATESELAATASIRIHRHACPVHVEFLKVWEYNDYDDSSFSSALARRFKRLQIPAGS